MNGIRKERHNINNKANQLEKLAGRGLNQSISNKHDAFVAIGVMSKVLLVVFNTIRANAVKNAVKNRPFEKKPYQSSHDRIELKRMEIFNESIFIYLWISV